MQVFGLCEEAGAATQMVDSNPEPSLLWSKSGGLKYCAAK